MDFLDRPAKSFMTEHFVVVDEATDVASAVKQMHESRAESMIVSRRGLAIGILTDDDIIDSPVVVKPDALSKRLLTKSELPSIPGVNGFR